MNSELILGIDGGASKTTALLADADGNILGRGISAGSNFQSIPPSRLQVVLESAVAEAFTSAGMPPRKVRTLCLGLSGADRPQDLQQTEDMLRRMEMAHRLRVMNDGWLLLWCGALMGVGVGLISGTGSIAFGRHPQGHTARAGGWGWRLGDEGSGYAVGLAALKAVTHAADGRGHQTSLSQAVLEQLGLEEPFRLIPYIYQQNPSAGEIARLAPLVLAEAHGGDEVARHILEEAAQELTGMVLAVARRLELKSPLPCALGGGWLVHADMLISMLTEKVSRAGMHLEPLERVEEPARGALRLAQEDLI